MTKPKVYYIGIGGIGTSALARWFLTQGWQVSGSDIAGSPITQQLKKQGIRVFIGHQAKNVPQEAKLVIYSSAVPSDNPELKKAKELRIITKSYAEALADLTKQYKTLAVTGAHGKSTATALLSLVLIQAGFDPTVIIGTKLKEFGGSTGSPQSSNFRNGKGNYLVLEADEYHGSFLNYSPFAAIITNIDREHLDYYKNLKIIKNTFLKFINNLQPNGILVVNKDDKNLFSLKNKIQKIAKRNKLRLFWYSIGVNPRLNQRLSAILKILGKHNLSNALAVYTLSKALKIKDKNIFSALSSYRGAWRRMEYRGELKFSIPPPNFAKRRSFGRPGNFQFPIKVYDDYAHHPTEIKATLAGIAQKWPRTGLICVFQPHQAQRLQALFKDFVGAFNKTNVLILLDIFKVAGRDSSTSLRASKLSYNINSKKLAEVIQYRINKLKTKNLKLKTIVYLPSPRKLPNLLKNIILDSKFYFLDSWIIVMMGAGDIYKYTPFLLSSNGKRKKGNPKSKILISNQILMNK